MANLNKVLLIGRMVEDPKTVNFSNGGRVAKFGFAVNNRKKNQSTGQWEDDPVFIDVEAYNREDGPEDGRPVRAVPQERPPGLPGVQPEAGHLGRQGQRARSGRR